MYCSECQEKSDNTIKIAKQRFCKPCIDNYKLTKCPNSDCTNVISMNGYNYMFNIDDLECDTCGYHVCEQCLVINKCNKYCKACFWNMD